MSIRLLIFGSGQVNPDFSQGCEIKHCAKLCAQLRVCLRFPLPLPLSTLPGSSALSLFSSSKQINIKERPNVQTFRNLKTKLLASDKACVGRNSGTVDECQWFSWQHVLSHLRGPLLTTSAQSPWASCFQEGRELEQSTWFSK